MSRIRTHNNRRRAKRQRARLDALVHEITWLVMSNHYPSTDPFGSIYIAQPMFNVNVSPQISRFELSDIFDLATRTERRHIHVMHETEDPPSIPTGGYRYERP